MENMTSLKIRLLIALLTFGVGILFVWFCFSAGRTEKTTEAATQTFTPEAADSRFDRVERDDNLQAEMDALLSLFDQMPPVPVYLKDEPMLKAGTNTERGAAYTH